MIKDTESVDNSPKDCPNDATNANNNNNNNNNIEEGPESSVNNLIDEMDSDDNLGSELSFLYSCLSMRPVPESVSLLVSSSIPSFVHSQPFPHQIFALCWMMEREGCFHSHPSTEKPTLHPLFSSWPPDPSTYIAPWTEVFSREFIPNEVIWKGGVLCDTMGLGKTFEMILLILMHPREGSSIPVKKELSLADKEEKSQTIETKAEPVNVVMPKTQKRRKGELEDEDYISEDLRLRNGKRVKYEVPIMNDQSIMYLEY